MAWTTIGDLSHSYILGHHGAGLREASRTLQVELTTGMTGNTRSHIRGDYSHLADIERNLELLGSYRNSISEATTYTDNVQAALQTMQDTTSSLGASLLLVGQSALPTHLGVAAIEAKTAFETLASTLNMRVADRSVFAGAGFDQAAMADSETILTALRAELGGETTLAGISARLDDWFDTLGGGFETLAYLGASENGAGFQLSEGTRLNPSIQADDAVFRDILKDTAMAALSGDATLGFALELRAAMIENAGNSLLGSQSALVDVQAELGVAQNLVQNTAARNEAATTAMTIARNDLLSVDPFEAATRLESIQTQIETLYAITARSHQLSFLEFMR